MKRELIICYCILFLLPELFAQKGNSKSSISLNDSVFNASFKWRSIGPFRGGRSCAVAGVPKENNTFYFGATGGGVYKTIDGGSNWKNISDKYFGGSIGAVAVANSDHDVIWVGEGEETIRGNVSEGFGIWKSVDGGKKWTNMGLRDSRHITRIIIHPKNPDIVYACALGHLFGKNTERGIYRTKDGGKTWQQILFINDSVGANELSMDVSNPDVLFASFWNVKRTPYSLESGGKGSSLWKTTDGGTTWKEIITNEGMPKAPIGKITVSVSPVNSDKIFAMVEADNGGLFRSDDGGTTWTKINDERKIRQRAWYFSRVYADTKDENIVYVLNVEFYKSTDGGKTFKSISTPHGDHHDFWIDADNNKRLIIADDGGAQISFDGGDNWSTYMNQNTAQIYRVTTDNHFPYRIYGAQQDNSSVRIEHRSYKSGSITQNNWQPTAGFESGHIVADPQNDDIVYGGNYNGYIGRLNHRTDENRDITVWPENTIGYGADSMKFRFQWNFPLFFSPHNPKRLYAAGNVLFYTEDEGNTWKQISPDLTKNDKAKQKPSGGLITKDNTGVEVYSTIFAACESPYEKELLWCGSDDGLVYVSKNGGTDWKNVTPAGMPEWMMINCIEPDPYAKGAAYIIGTRYKLDDFQPYIYFTKDYGQTWTKLTNGIDKLHFTRCLRADQNKKGYLYCGTEYGMYLSKDGGANWNKWMLNLPVVSITDLTIKDNDLIAATQGRGFWVLDDLSRLHQWSDSITDKKIFLFKPRDTWRAESYKNSNASNAGENPLPGVNINYFIKNKTDSTVIKLEFYDEKIKLIKSFASNASKDDEKLIVKKGMNQFSWNMCYPDAEKFEGMILWGGSIRGPMAPPGKYYVKLKVASDSIMYAFNLKKPGNIQAADADLKEQFDFYMEVHAKLSEVNKAVSNIRNVRSQMNSVVSKIENDSIAKKELTTLKDSIDKKLTRIEESMYQTKLKAGQDVLNYPVRLNDKLAGVMSATGSGESKPPKQCYDVYTELKGEADVLLNELKSIFKNDISTFNNLVSSKNIPAVFIKSDN